MSDYRHARRIRKGWQVFVQPPPEVGEPGEWLTVTHILRVYSPLNFVRLDLSDGSHHSLSPQDEVRCRTLAEVKTATRTEVTS
jgi:hypothetical protein